MESQTQNIKRIAGKTVLAVLIEKQQAFFIASSISSLIVMNKTIEISIEVPIL